MRRVRFSTAAMIGVTGVGLWLLLPRPVAAHCDTLDGPVVTTAKAALEKKDVTPVLKWVKKKHAGENVAAGREFVEAYVKFVHYAEGLYLAATGESTHHAESEKTKPESGHEHQ